MTCIIKPWEDPRGLGPTSIHRVANVVKHEFILIGACGKSIGTALMFIAYFFGLKVPISQRTAAKSYFTNYHEGIEISCSQQVFNSI